MVMNLYSNNNNMYGLSTEAGSASIGLFLGEKNKDNLVSSVVEMYMTDEGVKFGKLGAARRVVNCHGRGRGGLAFGFL